MKPIAQLRYCFLKSYRSSKIPRAGVPIYEAGDFISCMTVCRPRNLTANLVVQDEHGKTISEYVFGFQAAEWESPVDEDWATSTTPIDIVFVPSKERPVQFEVGSSSVEKPTLHLVLQRPGCDKLFAVKLVSDDEEELWQKDLPRAAQVLHQAYQSEMLSKPKA
jgi:hypothetical protein